MGAHRTFAPEVLEPACEWTAADVSDPSLWTEHLGPADHAEIERAMAQARARSSDFLQIAREDFPLPTLSVRLKALEHELIDGRGFVLIRGLPRERWSNDDLSLAYWALDCT